MFATWILTGLSSCPQRVCIRLALALALAGCAGPAVREQSDVFQHATGEAPQPWTHQRFDASPVKFSFAVFSDLTGGEREGVFDVAVQQLNLLRPELVINVGDLIEGSGGRTDIERQWDVFDARADRARAPVFYVGGNHDLVSRTLQAAWEERNGPRYYHFVYRNVLFLVLDSEDHTPERRTEINRLRREALAIAAEQGWDAFGATEYARLPEDRAGNITPRQSAYFRSVINDHPGVRWTFLFVHKAPWDRADNQPFVAIEEALSERPYTVFHGHQHAYDYQQRNGRDYIQLATTGGVFLPERGRSVDHLMLVTVDNDGVDIAKLLMAGILDKTGNIPLNGNELCFESTLCSDEP